MPKRRRILIVRPDRVGDVVLMTPLISSLKASYKDAFIAALVRRETAPVLEHNPDLNKILIYYPQISGRKQVSRIREYDFTDALLLHPTKELAWLLFFARIPNRIGVGTIFYQYLTLMRSVPRNYEPIRHEVDYNMDLGRYIGLPQIILTPSITLLKEERSWAIGYLAECGITPGDEIIAINPGSGRSSPNWKIERYIELAKLLCEAKNIKILLLGSSKEKKDILPYIDDFPESIIPLYGLSLRALISIISQIDILISSSTGPMHIASALGKGTISLFCPLPVCNPDRWGPLGNRSSNIFPTNEFCVDYCPSEPKYCNLEGLTTEMVQSIVWQRLMRPYP
ncbi:MAG: glycosyltransferase family 9 protein [Candidatus Coatesbacteria bacterium]|nr:glycosyltransferase family 9 protein [Candidatus Coatesbacteria bacterium]